MAKKVLSAALVLTLCLGVLAGCGNKYVDTQQESVSTEETVSVPQYISDIYDSYCTLVDSNDFCFEMLPGGPTKGEYDFFEIYFNLKGELEERPEWVSRNLSLNFYGDESSERGETFYVYFSPSKDSKILKDFITATFMVFDPTMSKSDAEEKMNLIVSSYNEDSCSDIEKVGDYYLFIVPDSSDAQFVCSYIPNREKIWPDVDVGLYEPLSNQLLSNPMSVDTLVCVSGVISDFQSDPIQMGIITLATDIGKCHVIYDLKSHPVKYNIGDSITVYGKLGEYGVTSAYSSEMVVKIDCVS